MKIILKRIGILVIGICAMAFNLLGQIDHLVQKMELTHPIEAFSRLGGVCTDRLGYLYVANFGDAVYKISPEGESQLITDGLYGSSGNTIDQKGNLFQGNFFSHSILKIDRFGKVSTFLDNGLNGPVGLAFDSKENLFICNFNENNIIKVTPDKKLTVFATGSLFAGPNGIVIDPDDNLFIVNFTNNDIIKVAPDGSTEVFCQVVGVDGNAHIAFHQNKFYVTKIKSNRIFEINTDGVVRHLAGQGKTGITNGPAREALFSAPNGIAVDPLRGKIYINNVNGAWGSHQPSTVDISVITLNTISNQLTAVLDQNDIDAADSIFWKYKQDPFNKAEDLTPALGTLGWRFMTKRNVPAAIKIFELQTEAYPDRWRGYFNLGDVYKIIGQGNKAAELYQMAIDRDPNNEVLKSRLAEVAEK